jgi:hypothetical protein
MKLRFICVLACAGLLAYSATSLAAQPQAVMACCESSGDCGSAKCCDYALIGEVPCTDDIPNWCMTACIPRER